MSEIDSLIERIYPDEYGEISSRIELMIKAFKPKKTYPPLSEKDVMMVTYADTIRDKMPALFSFRRFLDKYIKGKIDIIHFLPFYPYSSDDGFSVIDYRKIRASVGNWRLLKRLGKNYSFMYDAVINHISEKSVWFKKYQAGDPKYKDFFIEKNSDFDYRFVTRPRNLPLFYTYEIKGEKKELWATFSIDQLDLNFKNPEVLLKTIEILLDYVKKGARLIRLDAIGFLWKESGTSCINLEKTHLIVKLFKKVVNAVSDNVLLITETNVPHKENISYFGRNDEADLVYQFTLPPLTLFSLIAGNTSKLNQWLLSLEKDDIGHNTYLNFLSSHDGIGIRGIEGILDNEETKMLTDNTLENGGFLSYKKNPDGTQSVYEMNITYLDAVKNKKDPENDFARYLLAHVFLLTLKGLPDIYIHSLVSTANDLESVKETGISRKINRHVYSSKEIDAQLSEKAPKEFMERLLALIDLRCSLWQFNPYASEKTIVENDKTVIIDREDIRAVFNFSCETVRVSNVKGIDLISKKVISDEYSLSPYEYLWILRQA